MENEKCKIWQKLKKTQSISFHAGWLKGSYFVGWQLLQFLGPEFLPNHRNCLQGKKDEIFGRLVGGLFGIWLVCTWFVWFVGSLWVVWLACGWFGWFVGGFEFYS